MEAYKIIAYVAATLFFVVCAEAAVPLRSRSGETCTDHVTKKTYSVGETWYTGPPRECMQLTCDGDDTIIGLTCAPFQVPKWCSVKPGNPNAVYPGCCPTPVCPEPEENAIEDSSATTKRPLVTKLQYPSAPAPFKPYVALYGGFPYPPARP